MGNVYHKIFKNKEYFEKATITEKRDYYGTTTKTIEFVIEQGVLESKVAIITREDFPDYCPIGRVCLSGVVQSRPTDPMFSTVEIEEHRINDISKLKFLCDMNEDCVKLFKKYLNESDG